MTRLAILTISINLMLAAPALAALSDHDGGEGTYGLTNDKVTTNAGFLIIGGLPLFIFVLSLIQWRLDKRKDDRKKAAKVRASAPEWRGGW